MRMILAAAAMLMTLAATAATFKASQDKGEPIEVSFIDSGERVQLTLDRDNPDWAAVETLLGGLDAEVRQRWLEKAKALAGVGSDWKLVLSDGHHQVVHLGHDPEIYVEIHEQMAEEGARLAEEAERMVARLEQEGVMELKRFHLDRAEMLERMIKEGDLTTEQVERLRRALDEHGMK